MLELSIAFVYLIMGYLMAEIGSDSNTKWYQKLVVTILWLPLLIIVLIMEAWKKND